MGINIPILFRLVSGDYGKDGMFAPDIIDNLRGHWWVWNQEWDVKYPTLFGYRSKWLYTLFGRGKVTGTPGKDYLPYADVIVELGEKTRMYRGVVSEFTTDETGTLKDLLLSAALRGKFEEVEEGENKFYWAKIPGDCLIIKYSEVKSLNVTYVRLPTPSSPPK